MTGLEYDAYERVARELLGLLRERSISGPLGEIDLSHIQLDRWTLLLRESCDRAQISLRIPLPSGASSLSPGARRWIAGIPPENER